MPILGSARPQHLAPLPDEPLVSVITTCWNETAARIEATFATIAAQSYPRIERIVVDGGSGPATLRALAVLTPPADRMISEPDRGVMDAMNKGVRLSRGELFLFMNIGDAFAASDALTRLVAALRADGSAAFAYGDLVRVGRDGRHVPVATPAVSRFTLYYGGLCHQTALARRELFEMIGPLDEDLGPLGDMDWFCRVLEAGFRGVHAGITVAEYEVGGESVRNLDRYFTAFGRFRRAHFSRRERALYALGSLALRTAKRLHALDFTPPARLRFVLGERSRRAR